MPLRARWHFLHVANGQMMTHGDGEFAHASDAKQVRVLVHVRMRASTGRLRADLLGHTADLE
eukprot:4035602-Prymnesium_polylepis.1